MGKGKRILAGSVLALAVSGIVSAALASSQGVSGRPAVAQIIEPDAHHGPEGLTLIEL